MPYKQSWLDFETASGGRMALAGSPDEIRAQVAGLTAALLPQAPSPSGNVETKDGEVDGIKYRVYNPKGVSGPLPLCIWTHGGGYMTGNLDTDHLLCYAVSEHAKVTVVNVDYRLTPENPWPAQLEDCVKVYKWAHDNAASIGGDSKKMFTLGGSAGGALALQICNAILKEPAYKDSLKGVVALVPMSVHPDNVPEKYKSKYKAMKDNAVDVPVIDGRSMDTFYKYLKADPADPSAWTLLDTKNHKNFPPVYLASCEYDPLRDDAFVMEEALKEAGVSVKHDYYEGFPHYFWLMPSIPEGQEFVGNMLAGIGWALSQS